MLSYTKLIAIAFCLKFFCGILNISWELSHEILVIKLNIINGWALCFKDQFFKG